MAEFAAWNSFYVIVGAAAGALIGLQFVVVTLIADKPALRVPEAGAAFATPMIVHFGVVLLLAAVVSVPWHAIGTVAVIWGIVGLSGIVYTVVVARRLRRQTTYRMGGLGVSCAAALCGVCHAGGSGLRGACPGAPSPVCRWRGDAAAPLCGYSQCLGRRRVSRLCQ
jgi:hypothetical protein